MRSALLICALLPPLVPGCSLSRLLSHFCVFLLLLVGVSRVQQLLLVSRVSPLFPHGFEERHPHC